MSRQVTQFNWGALVESCVPHYAMTFHIPISTKDRSQSEFAREAAVLEKLKSSHIVNLLGSYKKDDRYFMLFPWADGDLRQFWEKHPNPQPSLKLVSWMAKQITGLLSALEAINGKTTTHASSSSESSKSSPKFFGRHGDIKPENILWYKEDPSGRSNGSDGVLKLTDFGLAKLRSPENGPESKALGVTATYRSPEFELQNGRISRNSDIWALGCVLLEYLTWYLLGWDATENLFVDLRLLDDAGDSVIKEDKFFNLVQDPSTGSLGAVTKPSVTEWLRMLRRHPNCSDYLADLLDLVENQMLCIDPKQRASSGTLRATTNQMYHKGLINPAYFLRLNHEGPSDGTALSSQPRGESDINTGLSEEMEPNLPLTMLESVDEELERTEHGLDEQQYPEGSQSPTDIRKQKQAETTSPDSPTDPIPILDEILDTDSLIDASCGGIQYTDFENSRPQAVQRLVQELRRMYSVHNMMDRELPLAHSAAVAGAASGSASSSSSATVTRPAPVYQFGSYQTTTTARSNRHASGANSGPSQGQVLVGNSQSSTQSSQPPSIYIELCINTGKHRLYLAEIMVDDSCTDGVLFNKIWQNYYRFRSRSDWPSWLRRVFKKPVDIHWVNFGLPSTHPELVDIFDRPNCIPPEEEVENKRYKYQECPMSPLPPMKFNNFYHYLEQARQEAEDPGPRRYVAHHQYSIWFKRFPKRVGSVHEAPEPGTFISGWGVYIVEGVRKTAIFCLLLFLFAVGISVGVIYAALYKTSEQGWGIAAVLTSFLFAVIGSVYTYWDEEYS
ncbi:hypothetical protein OQA88_7963 [Cercophora sp. LCS_1]